MNSVTIIGPTLRAFIRTASYTANFFNRYVSRTVPSGLDIIGVALATSGVTVNGQTTYRKGEYFHKGLTIANTTTPVWQDVNVEVPSASPVLGKVFVPQSPEAFTYDLDGNLTSDGRWTYTWDGENRLIRMVARTALGPQQRIDFTYDWQGRRIGKEVWNDTAGAGASTLETFIYDGWNLMTIEGPRNRTFLWGLDLSGSMQGAGGVGGLLAVNDKTAGIASFVCYDGNGNVAGLVNTAGTSMNAQYEYGPFGEVIRGTGSMARVNPFRWSTKYQDDETDLLYYGYRYYNASTGRWLSKDPISERGGKNLYALLVNNPISKVDYLGHMMLQNASGSAVLVLRPRLHLRHMQVKQPISFRNGVRSCAMENFTTHFRVAAAMGR